MQISNHGMKSNARYRRSPTTPHSEREGIFSFNLDFFCFEKIGIGIWTDICKVFTISPDIETKFSALSSSSILLSISWCLKITHHRHDLTGNFQTDPEWGNTEGREAWVMMTIPGPIHPNYCGQTYSLLRWLKRFHSERNFRNYQKIRYIESRPPRPRLQVEDPALTGLPEDWLRLM